MKLNRLGATSASMSPFRSKKSTARSLLPHCGAPQNDLCLHKEPEDLFFDIPSAPPGSISLTPLAGTVRLSGDEHFEVV